MFAQVILDLIYQTSLNSFWAIYKVLLSDAHITFCKSAFDCQTYLWFKQIYFFLLKEGAQSVFYIKQSELGSSLFFLLIMKSFQFYWVSIFDAFLFFICDICRKLHLFSFHQKSKELKVYLLTFKTLLSINFHILDLSKVFN